jgi:parallel beta-helix repeat protein
MKKNKDCFSNVLFHCIFISLVTLISKSAPAAVIYVPEDKPTIQAGIDAAFDGDRVIVANGVYIGNGNKNIDYRGKAITVQSENGPANCIIDCQNGGQGFIFRSNENQNSLVSGFKIINGNGPFGGGIFCYFSSPTIRNCIISNSLAEYAGGGISCVSSDPIISGCTISDNTSKVGGGIYFDSCSFSITNCVIADNLATSGGGGIYIANFHGLDISSTITDCIFIGNTGETDSGGGIFCRYIKGETVIRDCNFNQNSAMFGGGISCYYSSPTISNSSFTGNTAFTNGGGIRCNSSSPNIANCYINDNIANYSGGGIYCYDSSSPTISNCMIIGNTAVSKIGGGIGCNLSSAPLIYNSIIAANIALNNSGGGISCGNSFPAIVNSTLIGNRSYKFGGGIFSFGGSFPVVKNCIIWGDMAPSGPEVYDDGTSFTNINYSNIDQKGYAGNNGNIRQNPILVNIEDPNPSNWDFHLMLNSPCIDSGTNNILELPDEDFENDPRPFDGDRDGTLTADMGADEYVPIGLFLTPNTFSMTPGSIFEVSVTLRNNTDTGQTVYFVSNVTLPNGKIYPFSGYLIHPVKFSLNPYETISDLVTHTIPLNTPHGIYTYNGYVGKKDQITIIEKHFYFQVSNGVAAANIVD